MSDDRGSRPPWYADWFDQDYLMVYAHRDDRDAATGADLLARALAPAPGTEALDLGCGPGRHLEPLAAAGLRPTGLDLSPTLLAEAARLTAGRFALVRGDMRALPFAAASFGIVASFFTSFGYFDDAGNARVLAEIARVLRPAGRLFLDVMNRDHTLANIAPDSRRDTATHEVRERRRWDPVRQRIDKEIELRATDGTIRQVRESVRVYHLDEVLEMCRAAGLTPDARFGDYDGRSHDPTTSRRLIVTATRS